MQLIRMGNFIWLKCVKFILALISDSSKLQVKINICDTDSETENGIHIDGGLLLSHNYYPWSYEVRDFDTGRVCRKRFWGETGKKMIVSFLHNVDLAEEDKFRIRTKTNATVDYSSKTLVFGESDKYVQFEFTVSSGSKGGGGFAVCLKSKFFMFISKSSFGFG